MIHLPLTNPLLRVKNSTTLILVKVGLFPPVVLKCLVRLFFGVLVDLCCHSIHGSTALDELLELGAGFRRLTHPGQVELTVKEQSLGPSPYLKTVEFDYGRQKVLTATDLGSTSLPYYLVREQVTGYVKISLGLCSHRDL